VREFDVAIIGAGSAGLSARKEVVKKTQNYCVIDDGPLGTVCARVGCMPSKVLIHVANEFHHRHGFEHQGICGGEHLSVDHKKVMAHVRKLRDRFVGGVLRGMTSWKEEKLITKRATFIDENTLDLGDEKIKVKSIVIATGSRPILPRSWESYKNYFINTDDFFELETLPKTIAVIGLGVIGLELGQALSRLGVKIIGINVGKTIGGITDPVVLAEANQLIEEEFEVSYDGAEIIGEEAGLLVVKSGDKIWKVEKAFLTMGRAPTLKGLGLENIGVELNERGLPSFDLKTFQIPKTNIYFAGDVNAQRPVLHEASDEGRIAGYNSVRPETQCFRRREPMGIVFCDPNIAYVGKTFKELSSSGVEFITGENSFRGFGRTIVMGQEKGVLRVYADSKNGLLLGAELITPGGEHLAHLLAWVVNLQLTVFDVLSMPFYHPVLEEGLRAAFRELAAKAEDKPSSLEIFRCDDPPVAVR
jgi:dihydrolipoamide dehydrogenase